MYADVCISIYSMEDGRLCTNIMQKNVSFVVKNINIYFMIANYIFYMYTDVCWSQIVKRVLQPNRVSYFQYHLQNYKHGYPSTIILNCSAYTTVNFWIYIIIDIKDSFW